ncbi:PREDICTED: zinc finger protein Xfin [Cyphomyrmex costatus]|uniref:PR domain zinc finger protein 13 n=1 Tax=Cyphomyrmex costatus TaxID=456900 RepID=A0A195CHX4_9HYME|nr:PREDICTED: zinc finger protein Xfin [Cyphomyrmex costatus]KYN00340.1 PR domain zinc finger protein 13 [Cyphomyrmex costatus]
MQVMYPVVSEYETTATRSGELEKRLFQKYQVQKHLVQEYVNLSMIGRPNFFMSRPLVRAAGLLKGNSTTEIIPVSTLSEGNISITQHSVVEITDIDGRLHCLNGSISPSCWLKIITLATDFQNYNVLLMINNNGLLLKAIKDIAVGEPLLMWFEDCILTMLNIPFLTPVNCNIQGKVYMCHNCNSCFDHPNPLKLHLALDCNRMDNSYIWMLLANKIINSQTTDLSFNQYPKTSFTFELKPLPVSRPIALPIGIPTYPVRTIDTTTRSLRNDSPSSSNQLSSVSSNGPSPIPAYSSVKSPPIEVLPSPSTYESPIENIIERNRYLTLRPYDALMHRDVYRNSFMPYMRSNVQTESGKKDPAEVETIASDMGKCSAGYKCIFCHKIYSRKYGLRIHIRTHTGYKPLKCDFCQHRFGDPSNLNKHVRLHATGESRYKCNMCDKVLVRRRDLERHINSWHSQNANVSNAEINDKD